MTTNFMHHHWVISPLCNHEQFECFVEAPHHLQASYATDMETLQQLPNLFSVSFSSTCSLESPIVRLETPYEVFGHFLLNYCTNYSPITTTVMRLCYILYTVMRMLLSINHRTVHNKR